MYYTAAYKKHPRLHCLSYATAKRITDAFVDRSQEPWICPIKQGGAIDIAAFTDERNGGKRYVVYKIDGNAIGHGGSCGNTVAPIVPTPIMLQEVGADGHTLVGAPRQILTNTPADGPYVEAPALTYMNGKYVLFFSAHCYQTPAYDVQYAVADSIAGPYRRKGKLLKSEDMGLTAPGGFDVAINGDRAVYHG
jgi:beta-xylosidase